MTEDEAVAVARIAITADGNCLTCVGNLFEQLVEAFPEHDWWALNAQAQDYYDKKRRKELEDEENGTT